MKTIKTNDAWETLRDLVKGSSSMAIVTGSTFAAQATAFLESYRGKGWIIQKPEGLLLQAGNHKLHERPDTLIAIGGGSVIDYAKLLLNEMDEVPQFIAIPSTAGSGSEATPFAVAYEGRTKISVAAPKLLPQFAILDASLLQGQTPYGKAVSGMDAVAQAIESMWNLHATAVSLERAKEALALLLQHLPHFVKGDDTRAEAVLYGAHLSGQAIAITRTTGPHALSYYLTAQHGIPHGEAVGLFLPLFFLYNEGTAALQQVFPTLHVQNAGEAFLFTQQLASQLGLRVRLPGGTNVDELVQSVNQERFANNPVPYDREKLRALILQYLAA